MDGTIRRDKGDMKFWLRKRTSKANGTDFTAISLAPKKDNNGSAPKEMSINELADKVDQSKLSEEIPF